MDDDIKRLNHVVPGLAYREVRDHARLQRACERWPLLAAIQRALVTEAVGGGSGMLKLKPAADAAALWEE